MSFYSIFVLIIIFPWLLLYLIFKEKGYCWRESVLITSIICGITLTLITEVLSIFQLIQFSSLLIAWLLFNSLFLLAYLKIKQKNTAKLKHKNTKKNIDFPAQIDSSIVVILGMAFIVATIGLVALVAAPNNWDSMTYHMSRVVHWIQNQSVDHYPTSNLRQIDMNPWSEFAIMHLQILTHGDRFANCVQWFSMIGSIVGVSLIAKVLGAERQGQILSLVVCGTIPMGVLQASSTQNDYVLSFWLICFVYYVLATVEDDFNITNSVCIGGSLGLAILTKATAYIYAFPFCIWLFIALVSRIRWKAFGSFLISITLYLLINIGHYNRNLETFGSPLGLSGKVTVNGSFSIAVIFSNFIRNICLHIVTPLQGINQFILDFVYDLHSLFKIDINDQSTTILNFDMNSAFIFHEDVAGNFIHFFLILFSILIYIRQKELKKHKKLTIYLVTLVTSFLLFCLLLKWQPWGSRLHLPLFILFSPFVGIVISDLFKYKRKKIAFISFFLLTYSLLYVVYNSSRPLALNDKNIVNNWNGNILSSSRIDRYFSNRPDLQEPYISAINLVKSEKCSDIGLMIGPDSWEYPFWVIAKNKSQQVLRFEHINVDNPSSTQHNFKSEFIPCAVITVDIDKEQELKVIGRDDIWEEELIANPVTVFLKRE